MKKFLMVCASVLFLMGTSVSSMAQECFTIEAAHAAIAQWENGKDAVWETLKDGPAFDALVAWAKTQGYEGPVDSVVIVHAVSGGEKVVVWGISPDGNCIDGGGARSWKMTENQYNMIVGHEI